MTYVDRTISREGHFEDRTISREGHFERRHDDGRIERHTRVWFAMGDQYNWSQGKWSVEPITADRSIAFGLGARRRRDGTWFRE